GVALIVTEERATFERVDPRRTPGWQGVLSCSASALKRRVAELECFGLWEMNDFLPAVELLDGEFLIVRGVDTARLRPLEVDACLFCLDESVNPWHRKLAARLYRLLEM